MTEWWAQLEGNERDLELLESHLSGGEHRILKHSPIYYLKIADFIEDIDSNILHDRMSRLVAILNGAAKLCFKEFSGVKSFSVYKFNRNGTRTGFGFLTAPKVAFTLSIPVPLDGTLNRWVST